MKRCSLYLNIWMPPNANNLPVKFWIYGGGNTAGSVSNPTYSGCNLATDSVVVSMNYRLGPLGFLALQSGGVAGNMGIQDQLLGLQWVQENIRSFGGDPVSLPHVFLHCAITKLTTSSPKYFFSESLQEPATPTLSQPCHKPQLSSKQAFPSQVAEELFLEALPQMLW